MQELVSAHTIGDEVILNFFEAGVIHNAIIVGIIFTENKVFYNVEICVRANDLQMCLLENVDSVFISKK